MTSRWRPNDLQMSPKWLPDDVQLSSRWCPHDFQMTSKITSTWRPNDFQMTSNTTRKKHPRTLRELSECGFWVSWVVLGWSWEFWQFGKHFTFSTFAKFQNIPGTSQNTLRVVRRMRFLSLLDHSGMILGCFGTSHHFGKGHFDIFDIFHVPKTSQERPSAL